MKQNRSKPNFSMYLPDQIRADIDRKIQEGEYSSVAAFLIEAAKKMLKTTAMILAIAFVTSCATTRNVTGAKHQHHHVDYGSRSFIHD